MSSIQKISPAKIVQIVERGTKKFSKRGFFNSKTPHGPLFRVNIKIYKPLSPAPSANILSNSGVAPPVTKVLIKVSAESLK